MKRPQEEIATSRKTLPARRSKKNPTAARKPAALKKATQRRGVLRKGSDEELIKVFGEK